MNTSPIVGVASATPAPMVPQPSHRTHSAVSAPAPHKHTRSAAVFLLSGTIAGGIEATVTYPFEFAKTRAQLQSSSPKHASRSPFVAITHVVRSEGMPAIYTGCFTLILGTAFKAGVRFLSFDAIRTRLANERGVQSPERGMLAGMLASSVGSVLAVTPTESIETAQL